MRSITSCPEPCGGDFESPEYTANVDTLGTLRIGGANLRTADKTHLSGLHLRTLRSGTRDPQRETTPFHPVALRRRQALRLLDNGELPGGLRHVCLQWPFV